MSKNKWLSKLTSDFGKIASQLSKEEPKPIPTWSPSLNWALVKGGFMPGKVSILFGPESSGKSMLAMMAIIELQRRDPEAIAIWFDSEFSFSVDFFVSLGGDADRVIVRKTNDPLKIFDYIGGELLEALQDGAPVKAIVIDSIRAIRFPKDHKKQSTDITMGGTGANYLPSAFKMVIPVIAEYQIMSLFIQQVSIQIDPIKALRNPYVLPDGQALKHVADVMLEITKLDSKKGVIEEGSTITGAAQQTGHKVRVKVKKNRLGAPARMAEFTFSYGKGVINTGQEIYELGKSLGVIFHPKNPETGKENAQMWQFGNYDPIRGEANMIAFIANSKEIQEEVMQACYKYTDLKVNIDADGYVIDSEDNVSDIELDI
jgi:recombination protein RecA